MRLAYCSDCEYQLAVRSQDRLNLKLKFHPSHRELNRIKGKSIITQHLAASLKYWSQPLGLSLLRDPSRDRVERVASILFLAIIHHLLR